jgi:hypothetical protein
MKSDDFLSRRMKQLYKTRLMIILLIIFEKLKNFMRLLEHYFSLFGYWYILIFIKLLNKIKISFFMQIILESKNDQNNKHR